MTLQALRTEIGDDVFFRLLRRWAQTNRDGNVSTAGFMALAESMSGRDLSGLFDTWLSAPAKPSSSPSGSSLTAPVAVERRTDGEEPARCGGSRGLHSARCR